MLTLMMMGFGAGLTSCSAEDGRWEMGDGTTDRATSVERCIHVRPSSAWRKSY